MPGCGTDHQQIIPNRHTAQFLYAINIDQMRWLRHTIRHHRHQALPARQDTAADGRIFREQRQCRA